MCFVAEDSVTDDAKLAGVVCSVEKDSVGDGAKLKDVVCYSKGQRYG